MRNIFLTLRLMALLSFSFHFVGCSYVTTKHPLSNGGAVIGQEDFEGVWVANDKIVHVRLLKDGVALAAVGGWEGNHFLVRYAEIVLAQDFQRNFMSVRIHEENGEWMDSYFLFEYEFSKTGELLVWFPKPDMFKAMIEKERLRGVIKEHGWPQVLITNMPDEVRIAICDSDDSELFNYREPFLFRKL